MIVEPAWLWNKADITKTDVSTANTRDTSLFKSLTQAGTSTFNSQGGGGPTTTIPTSSSPTTTVPDTSTDEQPPAGTTTTRPSTDESDNPTSTTRPGASEADEDGMDSHHDSDVKNNSVVVGAVPVLGGIALADGPLPFGDVIAIAGLAAIGTYALFKGTQAVQSSAMESTPTGTTMAEGVEGNDGIHAGDRIAERDGPFSPQEVLDDPDREVYIQTPAGNPDGEVRWVYVLPEGDGGNSVLVSDEYIAPGTPLEAEGAVTWLAGDSAISDESIDRRLNGEHENWQWSEPDN